MSLLTHSNTQIEIASVNVSVIGSVNVSVTIKITGKNEEMYF